MNSVCPQCGAKWTVKTFAKGICPKCNYSRDSDLDSLILYRQRERISELVKEGKLFEAHAALNVVSELWFKYKLGHAYSELHQKIRDMLKCL